MEQRASQSRHHAGDDVRGRAEAGRRPHALRARLLLPGTDVRWQSERDSGEKRLKFEEAAGDLTLRRRLVVVQQATGLPPPPAAETFS